MSTVAFLGPRGTFTEQALRNFIASGFLPAHTTPLPVDSPHAALQAVRDGDADYACVAIESSVDGSIASTEDAIIRGERLQVLQETLVPIEFSIAARPDSPLCDNPDLPCTFTTHPVAEAQVRQWMGQHYPQARFIAASSNGAAAAAVAAGNADLAAAPQRAVEINQLHALARNVADVAGAYTRFILVGRPQAAAPRTGNDRTGVAFTVPNVPASLDKALQQLAVRGVDLYRISSRPTREHMGDYVFHVGIVGHITDDAVAEALAGLYRATTWVRFLGSWPRVGVDEEEETGATQEATAPPSYAASRAWVAELLQYSGGVNSDGTDPRSEPGSPANAADEQSE